MCAYVLEGPKLDPLDENRARNQIHSKGIKAVPTTTKELKINPGWD